MSNTKEPMLLQAIPENPWQTVATDLFKPKHTEPCLRTRYGRIIKSRQVLDLEMIVKGCRQIGALLKKKKVLRLKSTQCITYIAVM